MKSFERRTQVARAMQKELAQMIHSGNLNDDRVSSFVSIISVELNPSLSSAKVIYSLLGVDPVEEEIKLAESQVALNENAKKLRGTVARRLNLKFAPKLFFIPSSALRESVDLIHLIDETVAEDAATRQNEDL